MPGRAPQFYAPRTTVDASPALAAETVIGTFTGIDTADADSQVALFCQANFLIGTAGTAARLRVRQTAVAGTVVGDTGAVTAGIAAGASVTQDVIGLDKPGAVASFVYVLTLQITAATGASAVSALVILPVVY